MKSLSENRFFEITGGGVKAYCFFAGFSAPIAIAGSWNLATQRMLLFDYFLCRNV